MTLRPCQKFVIIDKLGGDAKRLCEIARVSRAGYYKWRKAKDRQPKDYDDYLLVKAVFDRGRARYGWRTIQMKLKADHGVTMNHKKIIRIKNVYNLLTKVRQRNPYKLAMKKTREHRVFANVLDRKFRQQQPQTVFCTDITYLSFGPQIAYLSAVKDIASREIVGWSLGQNLQMDLVFRTLEDLKRNIPAGPVLLHSDQGVHYTTPDFVHRVKDLHLTQSMSRKGNCIDNAPMESFFGHFKDEVDYGSCKTFKELEQLTATYIDYYNNDRQQWNLRKMAPARYRQYLLSESGQ